MNFSRVTVILDEKHFLPKHLQIYPPNFDARKNPARTVYSFADRQVNNPLHRGQQFLGRFISPKPPLGWKKVVVNGGGPAPNAPQIGRAPGGQPLIRRVPNNAAQGGTATKQPLRPTRNSTK